MRSTTNHRPQISEKIASEDKHGMVRLAAVSKLDDQNLYTQMLANDSDGRVRDGCLDGIDPDGNQELIKKIATEDKKVYDRVAAVKKLLCEKNIYQIMKNDGSKEVRDAALEKIKDRELLKKIALEEKDWNIQKKAIIKISGRENLLDALEKICDEQLIGEIVKNEKKADIRAAAAKKITDQSRLEEIVRTDPSLKVKKFAFERIEKQSVRNRLLTEFEKIEKTAQKKPSTGKIKRRKSRGPLVHVFIFDSGPVFQTESNYVTAIVKSLLPEAAEYSDVPVSFQIDENMPIQMGSGMGPNEKRAMDYDLAWMYMLSKKKHLVEGINKKNFTFEWEEYHSDSGQKGILYAFYKLI